MKKRFYGIGISFLATVLLFSTVASAASTIKTIDVTYRDIKLVIDGKEVVPKDVNDSIVEPFIYDGTTYLPIRAISQALNRRVSWDGTASTVYIGISNEPIIWQADLDHDGIDDTIVVETYMRDQGSDIGAIVSIYKGDSDLLLYSAEANVAHVGWDGFYLYYNDNDAYLMNWRPGMFQGYGDYVYELFCFDDSGEKVIFDSGSHEFLSQDLTVKHEGIDEFITFVQTVNTYLMQSYLLADTDEGQLMYGTPDDPFASPYFPEFLFYPGY